MIYKNFDIHITLKHGVIIENWPLGEFGAPGNFNSLPVINVLLSSWESGATRFRALSDDEWTAWRDAYERGEKPEGLVVTDDAPALLAVPKRARVAASFAPHFAPAPASSRAPTPAPAPASAPASGSVPAPAPASAPAPTQFHFLNVSGANNGSGIMIPKRPRKERKDKGQKRGPRAKKAALDARESATATGSSGASPPPEFPAAS